MRWNSKRNPVFKFSRNHTGSSAGARLQEPAIAADPTSSQASEQLAAYSAYSADGGMTAPLVYVNDGNREDYEELDGLGASVKGANVIVRYGHAWRGVKPKVAAERGRSAAPPQSP